MSKQMAGALEGLPGAVPAAPRRKEMGMAKGLIDLVTGGLEQKRRYHRYRARTEQLPAGYRTAVDALQRYMEFFGPGTGEGILSMCEDLLDLFEQSAANGVPVRAVVGEDPVEFAEAFLRNYPGGQWIGQERKRLTDAIDRVAGARR